MNALPDVADWFETARDRVAELCARDVGRSDHVPDAPPATPEEALDRLLSHNAALWGYEDEVRRTDISDAEIVRLKRRIDRENQLRNDMIDAVDALLEQALRASGIVDDPDRPMNTETPGSAFDRLAILTLRMHHLQAEIDRPDAADAHRETCRTRLDDVRERAGELVRSLQELLDDLVAGRKRLRSHGSHKLYNDPETNPAVRNAGGGPASGRSP